MISEIITGDCLEVLPTIPKQCMDLIFVDPPYNIGVDYGKGVKVDQRSEADYLAWCEDWMRECKRVLAPHGSMWVLINDEYADHFGLLLRKVGLHRRNWIIWYETFGVNCTNKFNRTSRHLFYCVADPKFFVFNRAAVSRPSDRQTRYKDKRANPAGKLLDSVWQIPRLCGTTKERVAGFPTQLPLELLRRIVGATSSVGDTVLDPMCGSATTGVVCGELGRTFVGIETSAEYATLARVRLSPQ